jgi:Na+-translocating ferredoxin:NAD+ oxidoreductase RnfG subunit
MDSLSIVLSVVVAVCGALVGIVSVQNRKLVVEFQEMAEVLKEAYKDKKITKDEMKEIMAEVIDVVDALKESTWLFKK